MSDKALDEAIRFAKKFDSKISILFIIEEQIVPPSILLSFIKKGSEIKDTRKRIIEILSSGAEDMLKDRADKIRRENIKVDLKVNIGSPAKEILDYIKEKKIDLIIMASRQNRGLSKIRTIGSVARKVSELSESSVMLVH